jgi:hypothetical protein
MSERLSTRLAAGTSRRGFLSRVSAAVMGVAGARSLIDASEAEGYHFCGHIYTTDGCPHPSGLPRIDSKGFPLRAADGHRIDDLGRPIDRDGRPLDERGRLAADQWGSGLARVLLQGPEGVLRPVLRHEHAVLRRANGALREKP